MTFEFELTGCHYLDDWVAEKENPASFIRHMPLDVLQELNKYNSLSAQARWLTALKARLALLAAHTPPVSLLRENDVAELTSA